MNLLRDSQLMILSFLLVISGLSLQAQTYHMAWSAGLGSFSYNKGTDIINPLEELDIAFPFESSSRDFGLQFTYTPPKAFMSMVGGLHYTDRQIGEGGLSYLRVPLGTDINVGNGWFYPKLGVGVFGSALIKYTDGISEEFLETNRIFQFGIYFNAGFGLRFSSRFSSEFLFRQYADMTPMYSREYRSSPNPASNLSVEELRGGDGLLVVRLLFRIRSSNPH